MAVIEIILNTELKLKNTSYDARSVYFSLIYSTEACRLGFIQMVGIVNIV